MGWRAPRLFKSYQVRDTVIGFLSHNWTRELAPLLSVAGPTRLLTFLSDNHPPKVTRLNHTVGLCGWNMP